MVKKKSAGFTIIELVIFMVVSSIALVGVLVIYQQSIAKSSEGIVLKQAMEAAYALLEEIQAMPFTYCDVADPAASTATSTASCATVQGLTPTGGKSRGSLTAPFNNVGDYGGYTQTGVTDINGSALTGLGTYKTTVSLSTPTVSGVSAGDAIRIDIAVVGPSGTQTLTGYRLRHSPNALP